MAIEIVDFPIENGGSFHSYVNLPEGIPVHPLKPKSFETFWNSQVPCEFKVPMDHPRASIWTEDKEHMEPMGRKGPWAGRIPKTPKQVLLFRLHKWFKPH